MTVFQGIILGFIQGVAEFLPISSSGHLKIAQTLLHLPNVPLLFDIFLHLATLFAVFIYFRQKIGALLVVFFRWITLKKCADDAEKNNRAFILAVIVSTLITGVLGVLTSKLIPEMSAKIVCLGFLVTALLLVLSALFERKSPKIDAAEKSPSLSQAAFIGFMQGVGTLPGISRSGSTIAGAVFAGVDRQTAGEYSFIVSIPAILGAFVLEAKDIGEIAATGEIGALPAIAGFIAAFVTGFFALAFLMRIIRRGKLEWFAFYLVPAAILGILFL